MRMRSWMCVLVLGLAITGVGCGDDSGEEAGGSGGAGGSSGASGASGGGSGASGGGSGASGGGSGMGSTQEITPEAAAAGACDMMGGGTTGLPECADLDAYNSCVLTDCGLQACYDTQCADYLECLQNAPDPCMANCTQSAECMSCITGNTACLAGCVQSHLLCTSAGGACDMLDECCAVASDPTTCMTAASLGPMLGDLGCQGIMMSFCPDL